jgi:O-antigen ligase
MAVGAVDPNGAGAAQLEGLYRVQPLEIWRFLRKQPASFWLVCFFVFLEYVRPQSIYPVLAVVPWSQLALVAALVALFFEGRRLGPLTIADSGIIVFTGVVLASSALAYDPGYAFKLTNISIYVSWVLVYFLVSSTVTTEKRFIVFIVAFLLYNLKMSQHVIRAWAGGGFGFDQWAAVGAPGWFHNPGEVGIEMVIFLPISFMFFLGLKRHWKRWQRWFFLAFPVTALWAIAATSSRGSQLAAAAVALWLLGTSRYKVRGVFLAVLAAGAVYLALPETQKERFKTMGEDKTSEARIVLWKDAWAIMNANPVLGVGYKNWIPYYRSQFVTTGQLPHNIFLEAGAEMGYTGVAAFVLLIGGTLALNRRTRRLAKPAKARGHLVYMMAHGLDAALVGYLVSGFFVTVLYYPFFWVNLAMTVSLYRVARNEYGGLVAGRRDRRAQRISASPA